MTKNLVSKIKKLKQRGKTIGLTQGSFDLLHVGHIDHLKKSRNVCDFLIVLVSSDKVIQRYKGETRPIIPAADRITLIQSVKYVGHAELATDVWVVQERVDLFSQYSPDVVTIGAEYGDKKISEVTDLMDIKLFQTSNKKLESTSEIIERSPLTEI